MHNRNRKIIKNIQKLKSLEKEIMGDEEINNRRKLEKVRLNALRQNRMIQEIRDEVRKELYKSDQPIANVVESNALMASLNPIKLNNENNLPKINTKTKDEDIIKEYFNEIAPKMEKMEERKEQASNLVQSYIPKIDPSKKPKWCLTKEEAEEMNDLEEEKLIEFAQNLDYEKYMKDMEVREALYLIKSKIEGGDENHDFKVEGKEENKEGENQNLDQNQEMAGRNMETDAVEKLKYDLNNKVVEHESDWNASVIISFF